jgi:hypothetical protein
MTYLFLQTLSILILCVDKIPPNIHIQWISIIFVWNPMKEKLLNVINIFT